MIEITQNYEGSVNLLFIQSSEKNGFQKRIKLTIGAKKNQKNMKVFSWQISGKGAGSLEKILGTFVRKEMF